ERTQMPAGLARQLWLSKIFDPGYFVSVPQNLKILYKICF
ncbi:MAG: hypothetical protein ACI8S3_000664, partial [Alphaproteobacteria bacterium]